MANQLNCLRCGTRMRFIRREKFQLGQTGWVLGDLPNLFAGAMDARTRSCSMPYAITYCSTFIVILTFSLFFYKPIYFQK